ncbi:MAG: helix-turn-helix domain-containing protein [Solirubrobacteraceae bacterium]
MSDTEQPTISINLSPTQIDEVVRAATNSRAPTLAALIADSLRAPIADEQGGTRTALAGESPTRRPRPRYMPSDTTDSRLSRSLLRGLSILTCFGPDGDSRGIVELAEDLGMSPSTAHRYALTLVELGLLERCPKTRKYRLPALG